MSRFIPIKTYHNGFVVDALVNIDHILMVWLPDYRDDMPGECFYHMTDGFTTEHAAEPYDTLVAKILAASTTKEKENLPPTPPIREKEVSLNEPRACAREGNLTCEGVLIPTLDEVKAAAPGLGVDTETAEDFWSFFYGLGWKYKGDTIRKWQFMLKAWHRARKRSAAIEDKRTAHIDAKMDAREAKREKRMGGRRKADNNVEMSDKVREEVRRDFDI